MSNAIRQARILINCAKAHLKIHGYSLNTARWCGRVVKNWVKYDVLMRPMPPIPAEVIAALKETAIRKAKGE